MAEKKKYLPQSSAGLVRYYDTGDEVIKINPKWVIALGVGFAAVVILLKFAAPV